MPIAVTVKFDKAKLAAIQKTLKGVPGAMPKVMARGINKTAAAAAAEIKRQVAGETTVKKKDVSKAIKISKANYNRWQADVNINDRRIPLFKFRGKTGGKKTVMISTTPKQSAWLYAKVLRDKYGDAAVLSNSYTIKQKRYVNASYEIEKGKCKSIDGESFIATMKSGHKGMFKRTHPGSSRITELMGPSVGGMLGSRGRVKKVKVKGGKDLMHNIDVQVKLLLEKRRA